MDLDREPARIPGQLDVDQCIRIAQTDGSKTKTGETTPSAGTAQRRPLTAAEVVARKLKQGETE